MMNRELHLLDPGDSEQDFPDPATALTEPNGLLALGGDLTTQRLLKAYDLGIFPWYNPGEPILWWAPNPRTVFFPEHVHISSSMKRRIRKPDYAVTLDTDFNGVLEGCAAPRDHQNGTWLGSEMRLAYARLHRLGHAHSIEVWRAATLVGGLYGVVRGRAFFGESMFSRTTDASKLALIWLSRQLEEWGFNVLDAQVGSPHLYRMGAVDISRPRFQKLLGPPMASRHGKEPDTLQWSFDITVPEAAEHIHKAHSTAPS